MATNKLIDLSRLSRFWDKAKDYISNEVSSKQDDMSGGSIRNVDLNDLIETKTYWVNNDNILNAPTNTYGYLEVFAQGSSLRLQRWTTFGSYDVYERYYVNSQWYSWKKISANDIIDKIYPVGSIYMSVTDSTVASVQARFGGTWVAFGAGRTLVGVNTSDTDFNTVEKTGGEKKHTLSTNEIPSHNHGIGLNQTGTAHFNGFWHLKLTTGTNIKNTNADETIGDTATTRVGGGQSHNNLQPYITVYMYKRTA